MVVLTRFEFLEAHATSLVIPKNNALHLASSFIGSDAEIDFKEDKTDQYIYLLKKGVVKVCNHHRSNLQKLQYLVDEGQFFGELTIIRNQPLTLVAEPVGEAEVLRFSRDSIRQLMGVDLEFNAYMLQVLHQRMQELEQRLDQLVHMDSKSRVLRFLEHYAVKFGRPNEGNLVASHFLKNNEIAQLTHTSRQTVNAVMNQLRRIQKIDFDQERIVFFGMQPKFI